MVNVRLSNDTKSKYKLSTADTSLSSLLHNIDTQQMIFIMIQRKLAQSVSSGK